MATTKIVIELEIEGDPRDAYHVVDRLLDAGFFQDAVNDHDVEDTGVLHVKSAVHRACGPEFPSAIIERLVEVLWPDGNPNADHDSDTIGEVARLMEAHRPERECRACAGLSNDGHDPAVCEREGA